MLSSFCLLVSLPFILVIAALIRLESPGPILYAPQMVGRNGKLFRLFRFRTMLLDQPANLGPEERLTRIGRFLRNHSLDHLPALLNILRGDLSVVGPRPMEPEFVDLQDPTWRTYFRIRPGCLNYAVLKLGRTFGPSSASNLPLKQGLEVEYIQRQSVVRDLQLLLQFVRAYMVSRGNVKARGEPAPGLEDRQSPQKSH